MSFSLTKAMPVHQAEIEQLIVTSVRSLGRAYYRPEQIDAALKSAWGVDSQLIADGTYFLMRHKKDLVACGGWSYRGTLFGSDVESNRSNCVITPGTGAAKIRAFFVKPEFARKGLGSRLLRVCEHEARRFGYDRLELMATLPGQKLYEKHGYTVCRNFDYPLGEGLSIKFVHMVKESI